MFSNQDQRARFQDKAHDHAEPRAADAFNQIATPKLVEHVAGLRVWFLTNGLEAQFIGALEGIFEAIGEYPMPEDSSYQTVEHAALSRIYRTARQAWQAERKGEAA
jgi:hypothetical protein